jgi:uncharacterized cofD-like protein
VTIEWRGRPRAVALGGGSGLAAVLRGLRGRAALTAVVAVAEGGGAAGRPRRSGEALLAPGDARDCLVALAPPASPLARLFQLRFAAMPGLEGHSLGTLVLAALAETEGSFARAIERAARLLGIEDRVLPATEDEVALEADLAGGRTARGEEAIRADPAAKEAVRLVRLGPSGAAAGLARAAPGVLGAIAEADLIVLGPGSLFKRVLPALLPRGIADALRVARGLRVLVADLAAARAGAERCSLADELAALLAYAGGRVVDVVLAHAGPLPGGLAGRGLGRDAAAVAREGATLVEAPLLEPGATPPRHDPALTADALLSVLSRARAVAPAPHPRPRGAWRNGSSALQ